MKDAFDVLMITHAGLCKGYADALKLILDIDEDDFGTLSFENGESLDDFSEAIRATIEERYKDRNLVVLLDLPTQSDKSAHAGTGNHGNEEERYDMGGAGPR
mgnify:CR=1 FL=1